MMFCFAGSLLELVQRRMTLAKSSISWTISMAGPTEAPVFQAIGGPSPLSVTNVIGTGDDPKLSIYCILGRFPDDMGPTPQNNLPRS